jgi:uncharacterized protein (DUF433 family)
MEFKHIISDPEILGGKPVIKGTRISVQLILEWIASGANIKDIVNEFPYLSEEAVKEAVLYASRFLDKEIFLEVKASAA